MEIAQFFFTLFCQVFFCLGLNKAMEEGMIFYWMRKPFENLYDMIENFTALGKPTLKLKIKYYMAKPLVLCITCFASVWGASVFITLNGLSKDLLPYLILTSFISSYIQTAIYAKVNI